jgi:hypothetical protein
MSMAGEVGSAKSGKECIIEWYKVVVSYCSGE